MMRQSSSRNQRSRGWKAQHVLQICVLVAVCVWLAYQVKHSHDKKKALEEKNATVSDRLEETRADILKLGRKDPQGSIVVTAPDGTNQNGEVENKEVEEAEEHENKQEENEEDGRGTGADEILETDREKDDDKEPRGTGGDDILENDPERDDEGAEGGDEFGDEEEREGQVGNSGLSDNQDHEDDVDGSSQEAREENYKADDASSAVVRQTQEVDQQNENLVTESSEEHKENAEQEEFENGGRTNMTEDASKGGEGHDVSINGEGKQYSNAFMETAVTEREQEVGSLSNSTVALESAGHIEEYNNATSDSNDQTEQQNISTISEHHDLVEQQNNLTEIVPVEQVETESVSGEVNAETVNSTPENVTVDMGSAQDQITVNETSTHSEDNSSSENDSTIFEPNNQIEQPNNSTGSVPDEQAESESMPGGARAETVDSAPENATANMDLPQDENTVSETTTLMQENPNSENIPAEQTEKSSPADENGVAGHGEATTSSGNVVSVAEEEQVAQTDLSTLPDIATKSVEGIAAE